MANIYRLTVMQEWRDGVSPEPTTYNFTTMQDAKTAQDLLKDMTLPLLDDMFCTSSIEEVAT